MKSLAVVVVAMGTLISAKVATCPGDSRAPFTCDQDETHRVCAQLLDDAGKPLEWGSKGTFWEITSQSPWTEKISGSPNPGDSWCICMWATAELIQSAGCDAVHLHCESTDVEYILGKYEDGGVNLKPAHDCLKSKCPTAVASREAKHQRRLRRNVRKHEI